MSTIMVQVTDRAHTLAALHTACCLARDHQHEIVLLKLIPVTHPSWLGTEWGYLSLDENDGLVLGEYQRIARRYGIEVEIRCVQVVSTLEGILWAAECVNAQIVFAHLPHSLSPFWQKWRTLLLRRRLAQRECQLYRADDIAPDWTPLSWPTIVRN